MSSGNGTLEQDVFRLAAKIVVTDGLVETLRAEARHDRELVAVAIANVGEAMGELQRQMNELIKAVQTVAARRRRRK